MRKRERKEFINNCALFEVDEIIDIKEKFVKNIDVYNLEVDDIPSYCANRIAVHNCLTETKMARENARLIADREDKPKEKLYYVYAGRYNNKEKPGTACNKWLGKICLLVDNPRGSDIVKDKYADYAIWVGKNNVGRKANDWWLAIPTHPHCTHYFQKIDPEVMEWDSTINKITFKVE